MMKTGRDSFEDLLGSPVAPPPPIAPTFDRHGDDFLITWSEHALNFSFTEVHKNRDGIKAELAIQLAGSEIHFGSLSLASTTAREQLVRKLSEIAPDLGWRSILEHGCRATVNAIRRGTPAVLLSPRPAPATRHLVEPLLLENDINVVFGPPGTLKSLIAAVVARLATTKGQLAGLSAYRKCPVMIVDGEANLTEWEGRCHLLNQGHPESAGGLIHYRRLSRSIDTEAAALRAEISRLAIGLVIIDSFGIAAGAEPETADAAIRVLSTLRELGPYVTTLLICHVSQASAEQKQGATKPYGSIYVQALGRNIWEARRDDEDSSDVVVSLYHRKSNSTRKHAPVALRFDFQPERITVTEAKIGDRPELLARAPLKLQIRTELLKGAKTIVELATELDQKEDTIRRTLSRMDDVTKHGAVAPFRWGLALR
jgi:hypothetical protein